MSIFFTFQFIDSRSKSSFLSVYIRNLFKLNVILGNLILYQQSIKPHNKLYQIQDITLQHKKMIDQSNSGDFNDKNRKSWSEQQDNILIKLVKKYGTKRWTDISKAMVDMFDVVGKSGKQCRQRWVNHLDPKINKLQWTLQEERRIFESHKIYGNKWKIIAKNLDNRTDNSIKNHFYSILRKGLRRINKMMGDRKSTQKVKDIRTSVLSKLCKIETQINDESLGDSKKKTNVDKIYQLLFQFSSMKSQNVSQKNLTQNLKDDFRQMIFHLMNLSSQQKIKKEQNILQNKEKKLRKNSNQQITISDQNQQGNQLQIELQKNQEQDDIKSENDSQQLRQKNENEIKFMVLLQSPQKQKHNFQIQDDKILSSNLLKVLGQQNTSQASLKSNKNPVIILEKQNQTQNHISNQTFSEDFNQSLNIFPNITINLEEQSCNLSQSKDGYDFNQLCFINSPLFSTTKMYDQFNIRTPRVYSPGAFNFCGGVTTAHSYMNLTGKDTLDLIKSSPFDNQLDSIVQQLRSNIDANCGQKNASLKVNSNNNFLRVNSSRNSNNLQSCFKNSLSSSSLTPQSSSERAH